MHNKFSSLIRITAKTVQAERKLDDDNEISRGYLMPLLQVEGYIALNKAEQWT